MKAVQLLRRKFRQGEVVVEMVIWQLPGATPDRPHRLKYRLYCGRNDECLVRYDNEAGKGDHRHYGEWEEPYAFTGVDKLIEEFRNDCARLAGWQWDK
jgi:hypothetical protein